MTIRQRAIKRGLDVLLATALLVVMAVPLLFLFLLVLLVEGRPVLFRQDRVGRGKKRFTIVKFRTMTLNGENGVTCTTLTDPRVPRGGRFLRRYKLDEIPQIWQVLIGEMSFVGPRPDVPGYVDKLGAEYRAMLDLRPGLTGPATIFFRHEEELLARVGDPKQFNDEHIYPRKIALNMAYAQNWSLLTDLVCMLHTAAPFLAPPAPRTPEELNLLPPAAMAVYGSDRKV